MLALATQAVESKPRLKRVLMGGPVWHGDLLWRRGDHAGHDGPWVRWKVSTYAPQHHQWIVPITFGGDHAPVRGATLRHGRVGRPWSGMLGGSPPWPCWACPRCWPTRRVGGHQSDARGAFLPGARLGRFRALGAVVLVVTGGEALYADLGHFGSPSAGPGMAW